MSLDLKFRALTPNTNIDLHYYKEALDYVFSSSEIRNIALSGSYGSGKSSVIRSYENTYPDRTFIHISLAHFDEQGQSSNTRTNNIDHTATASGKTDQGKTPAVKSDFEKADSAKLVKDLEGKILNQLIHQIPPKSLPRSQRQIKSKSSKVHNILIAAAITAFAAFLIYVLWFHKWVAAVNTLSPSIVKTVLLLTDTPYLRLFVVLLLLLACGAWLFYFLDTHDLQKLFKKVDFKGIIGIELFEAEDDSYFDKYLNKVLYLFDQADADAIVFEDLDRYDVTLIFEKLREINDLVHSRTRQGLRPGKKPLKFFYLIRDDVFTTADRSKFFDFIIPVVPYVDASNSCDQLLQRFDEVGLGDKFNKRFLQDVSLYLSDMRLLSNIVNEYIVYSGRLRDSGLDTQADRQLAMIIYKNIYPGDFDLLQHGRGYVFALFENKGKSIDVLLEQTNSNIEKTNQQLTEAEHERLKNLDELNALFFPLSEEVYTINGKFVDGLDRTELVKQILQSPNNVIFRRYSSTYKLDVEAKIKEMEANPEYSRRKKILEDTETYFQSLNSNLSALESKKQGLKVLKIHEILARLEEDAEKKFWSPDLPSYEAYGYIEKIQNCKNFNLLKYLIRNGYIDENYAAYVSYFYPNSLTAHDRNFLLALSDHTPLDYEYHLDHPDAILNRLDLPDFTRKEIRNSDLLNYLLEKSRSEELHALIQACDDDNEAYKFIIQFWHSTSNTQRLICLICKEQPEWFREWYESGLLKGSEWKLFLLDSIYFLSSEQLLRINVGNWLTDAISSDSAFIKIDQPDVDKLVSAFKSLNVQFSFAEYREMDLPLLREIYRENLYVLNLPMLRVFLKEYFGASELEAESRSYSYISCSPDEPLSKRVLENMDVYAEAILHESTVSFSDDEIAAIDFLNCETLSEEYKQEYIQRLDTVIEDINSIKERSLWSDLIEYRRLEYTWENIADYFAALKPDSDDLTPELAEFINSGTGKLGWRYDNLTDRIGEDSASKLCRAILSSTELPLDRYRTALEGFSIAYEFGLPVTVPSDEQMKIVLELNLLPITVDNIEEIRKKYSHHWTDFVFCSGVDELLALMTNEEALLSEDELTSLLEDNRITTEAAFGLMEHFDSIPLEDRVYSPEIKAKIIEEHLSQQELPGLLRSFEQESNEVRTAFLNYVADNADIVAAGAIDAQHIPAEIYAACLADLPPARAETLRQFIPDSNFELVCTGNCKPTFPDTVVTRTILDYFKRQRWISSYSILDNGRIRAYPTRKQS